jgi:hypothetical protein
VPLTQCNDVSVIVGTNQGLNNRVQADRIIRDAYLGGRVLEYMGMDRRDP